MSHWPLFFILQNYTLYLFSKILHRTLQIYNMYLYTYKYFQKKEGPIDPFRLCVPPPLLKVVFDV